ncbi:MULTISPECIES: alpha/beta hydrolase family protein [unclassified Pseudomonas]|jgi:pimeloyl-ACP methyl ester carboxylesterase|uniref:alpha/beta hydrolase family protein n=1 Tax=unclassified Pseudomonas TaxID=196821 RepID=UPI00069CF328|nr:MULTISPECIES: esterase [unclassified Pseudomonas]WPN44535.1 alpha/beta hydrolase [Pseudomonas sp. P8_241]
MCVSLASGGLTGCADPNRHAESLALSGHLYRDRVDTDGFVLTGFHRISRPDLPLTVYIEGDGKAWRTRTLPSDNPSPHQALGLTLAAVDPAANVVYLARPCQFTPLVQSPRCDQAYWTDKRFAEEVVVAMNQAVSHYAARVPGQRIHLVGYSGGGALAVLIAARRQDIASLRTVAGNLDHAEVNRLHQVPAMPESLNAIDVADQIAAIPQIHFSGADDSVVPPVIAQHFVSATDNRCARSFIVAGMNHESDWARRWPELLAIFLPCSTSAKHE